MIATARSYGDFIPDNILGNLKYLPEIKHTSYVDSPPSILFYDENGDGNVDTTKDLVVLVFGQRRGGGDKNLTTDSRGAFYALNITDINNPTMMWKLDTDNYDEMAETWSLATIKRIKVNGSTTSALWLLSAPAMTTTKTFATASPRPSRWHR